MTLPGALLAYHGRAWIEPVVPYLLAISGAGFLYVVATDLAPVLHHRLGRRVAFVQFVGLVSGVLSILLLRD
ncbi:MAG: hypothetical protein A2064_12410 [Spirochaetes bacterium GWB1_66_5]|nr:MAG: hypothetical protein A2064_12410 [Spirochaetes bacterium GWB1_66_5]